MALGLHVGCRSRLIDVLTDELPALRVTNNVFLDHRTTSGLSKLDEILPENNSFRKELQKLVSDEPASDFVTDRISELLGEEYDESAGRRSLVEIDRFGRPNELASNLIEEFESLPWRYTAFVRLPHNLSRWIAPAIGQSIFQLSENFCLLVPDDDFASYFSNPPNHSPEKGLGGLGQLANDGKWSSKHVYIQGDLFGFVGFYSNTTPIEDFKFAVRAICGLGIANRLFHIRKTYYGGPRETQVVVFKCEDRDWKVRTNHSFSEEFSEEFESIEINNDLLNHAGKHRNYFIRKELEKLATALQDFDRNEPLIRAAQWLFDSYCGRNNLLAFVQATVALEILLGDKAFSDVIGLGKLLGNRCAYLIGITRTQRDEVLKDFERIYDTRSKIVHRGKNRLTASERTDLLTLRWMCARVIQEELKLIKKDAEGT